MHRFLLLSACGLILGCSTSEDPADGGFVSGVAALSSGTYDARIAEREGDIAEGQATQLALQTELEDLNTEHNAIKLELIRLRSALVVKNVALDAETSNRVTASINAQPTGQSEAERIAALRRAIADAKALSETLRDLSG